MQRRSVGKDLVARFPHSDPSPLNFNQRSLNVPNHDLSAPHIEICYDTWQYIATMGLYCTRWKRQCTCNNPRHSLPSCGLEAVRVSACRAQCTAVAHGRLWYMYSKTDQKQHAFRFTIAMRHWCSRLLKASVLTLKHVSASRKGHIIGRDRFEQNARPLIYIFSAQVVSPVAEERHTKLGADPNQDIHQVCRH